MQIHDRDAHDDVLETLRRVGAPEKTVFHCFSGDDQMARIAADAGYWLSFAGNVTFKNAQNLRDALAVTPLDRILVETDAPFLTPVPLRGRPNAPYLVPITVRSWPPSSTSTSTSCAPGSQPTRSRCTARSPDPVCGRAICAFPPLSGYRAPAQLRK